MVDLQKTADIKSEFWHVEKLWLVKDQNGFPIAPVDNNVRGHVFSCHTSAM